METLNLTKRVISDLPVPPSGRVEYRDAKDRYLHLRISAAGARVWYYIRKIGGRKVRKKLGGYPDITPVLARDLAARESAALVVGGPERVGKLSMAELWKFYIDTYARGRLRSLAEYERRWRVYVPDALKGRQVDNVTAIELTRLHARLSRERGKVLANRVIQTIRTAVNWGRKQGLVVGENPANAVQLHREQPRERFLHPHEVGAFMSALEAEPNPDMRDFFRMALWTGQRRANVQAMRWADIDMFAAVWTIPASEFKTGRARRVALTTPAMEVLRSRHSQTGDGIWVFPSPRAKCGHIVEPRRSWKRLLESAGLENLTIHDLRRTLGSWQAAGGASMRIIGESLGHADLASTAIYARLNLDPVRDSMENAAAAIRRAGERKG